MEEILGCSHTGPAQTGHLQPFPSCRGAVEQGAALGPHQPLVAIGGQAVYPQAFHIQCKGSHALDTVDDEQRIPVVAELSQTRQVIAEPGVELHRAHRIERACGVSVVQRPSSAPRAGELRPSVDPPEGR